MGLAVLTFEYVGKDGRHTHISVDDEVVEAIYFTSSSLLLSIWCVCDMSQKDVQEVITNGIREEGEFGNSILLASKDRALGSKYDILFDTQAVVNAYLHIMNHGGDQPLGSLLFALDTYIQYFREKYSEHELEVNYELNESRIYTSQ